MPEIGIENVIIKIGGIGFKQKEIEIAVKNSIIDLGIITLEGERPILSEFYVTRKRSFFGKILRKITRPFRKK